MIEMKISNLAIRATFVAFVRSGFVAGVRSAVTDYFVLDLHRAEMVMSFCLLLRTYPQFVQWTFSVAECAYSYYCSSQMPGELSQVNRITSKGMLPIQHAGTTLVSVDWFSL
jgi:hypothetical protein